MSGTHVELFGGSFGLVGPLVWWVDIIKIMEIDRIKLTHTISIQLGI